MDFETIEPNVWKPEKEEDMIEGVLIRKDTNVGQNQSNTYHLEKDGKQVMIWGTTVLDDRMAYTREGDYLRVTYKGTRPNKRGQETKIFKVEKAKNIGKQDISPQNGGQTSN